MTNEQEDYIITLNEIDRKSLLKEIKRFMLSTREEGEINFPGGETKMLKRDTVNEIWTLIRLQNDGESKSMAWFKAHGGQEIKD